MANRTFTMNVVDFDMNTSVVPTDAGSAAADVVIVDVAENADRDKVVIALHALADLISSNQQNIN